MAADVQALIADQQFQGLSPADKRSALSGVTKDASFDDLGDADTLHFVSKMTERGRATRPDLYAPPSVPQPQVNMQMGPDPLAALPNPKLNIANAAKDMPEYVGATGALGAGAMGAAMLPEATVPTLLRGGANVAKAAWKAAPYVAASEGINYLRGKLGKTGSKFIPSGAEMLPYFMMGGAKGGAAAKEAAGTSAAEAAEGAGASGARVPVGKFAKEVPTPDPYQFKGAPGSMDIVQSTNVGKVGYEPDSRTMTVEYKSGQVYSYHGVPQEIYKDAQDADSIGSYISRNIKGRYETVRRGSVLVKKK